MRSRGSKTVKPFAIVGRLQLSTGEGTWDEWHVSLADGGFAWLAEAQGGFWMMLPLKPPPVPEWTKLVPGQSLDLGAYGRYAVAEVREATYVSAEGDLPFMAPPGRSSAMPTSPARTGPSARSTTATTRDSTASTSAAGSSSRSSGSRASRPGRTARRPRRRRH